MCAVLDINILIRALTPRQFLSMLDKQAEE